MRDNWRDDPIVIRRAKIRAGLAPALWFVPLALAVGYAVGGLCYMLAT